MSYLKLLEDVKKNQTPSGLLDTFFTRTILPRLAHLHMSGNLPDLSSCPLWGQMEKEWEKAGTDSKEECNVQVVKNLMMKAILFYERADKQDDLFAEED